MGLVVAWLPGCVGYGRGDIHTDTSCAIGALDGVDHPVTVRLWHTLVAAPKAVLDQQIAAFNASQDRVRVVGQYQGGPDEVQAKVEQAAPEGDLPALVNLNDTSAQWAADSGLFTHAQACIDADPEIAATYDGLLPIVRHSYEVRGELVPVVFQTSTGVLYYNRAHFTEAGLDPDAPPQTLVEIYEAAVALKASRPDSKPLSFLAASWVFEWLLSGVRQPIVSNDNGRGAVATRSTLDNPRSLEVIELLQRMQREGLVDVIPASPGQADHILAMALQQSSMLIEGSQNAATVAGVIEGTLGAADLRDSLGVDLPPGVENLRLDLDIGVGELPGLEDPGRAQVGGSVWYLPATSDRVTQAAAWEFVRYINQPDNQALWATRASITPPFAAVAAEPSVRRFWADELAGRWEAVSYRQMAEGTDPNFPGPLIGPYLETRSEIEDALDRVLLSGEDPHDSLARADRAVDRALRLYRDDRGG